ncbi:MAG TPA: hypothetical protein VEL51_00365 [Vicinamibacterales bacterium]|nr:hypothetical protein [Vicinamibacterales bacterium]
MRYLARAVLVLVVLGGLLSAGCSKPVDLKQALQVTDVITGYHDAGVVAGKNKIVPSITFRLKKQPDTSVRPLSLNVAFKKLPPAGTAIPPGSPTETDWDEKFVQSVPFQGDQTGAMTFQGEAGYTAEPPQTRADILKHRLFQDVRVHIFAKHSASQWVEIASFDIPRQLLTQ